MTTKKNLKESFPSQPTSRQLKSFVTAACKGNIKVVRDLLKKYPGIVNMRSERGQPALVFAAGWGNKEIVSLLLQKGADINIKNDEDGNTPLISAAGTGQLEIIRLLLEKGADITLRNERGETALDEEGWRRREHKEQVEELLQQSMTLAIEKSYDVFKQGLPYAVRVLPVLKFS